VRFEATSADSHVVIPKPSQFADYFAWMLAKDRGLSGSPGGGVAIPKAKPTNFDHVEWLRYTADMDPDVEPLSPVGLCFANLCDRLVDSSKHGGQLFICDYQSHITSR
jgi:hypothetical protein